MCDTTTMPIFGCGGWPATSVFLTVDDAASIPQVPAGMEAGVRSLPPAAVWGWYPVPPVMVPTGLFPCVVELESRTRAMATLNVNIAAALKIQEEMRGMRKWDANHEGRLLETFLKNSFPLDPTLRITTAVLQGAGVRMAPSSAAQAASVSPLAHSKLAMSINPVLPSGFAVEAALLDDVVRRAHRMLADAEGELVCLLAQRGREEGAQEGTDAAGAAGGDAASTNDAGIAAIFCAAAPLHSSSGGGAAGTGAGGRRETLGDIATARATITRCQRFLALVYERMRVRDVAVAAQPSPPARGKPSAAAPTPPPSFETGVHGVQGFLKQHGLPALRFVVDALPDDLVVRLRGLMAGTAPQSDPAALEALYASMPVGRALSGVIPAMPHYTDADSVHAALCLWVDWVRHCHCGGRVPPAELAGPITAVSGWVRAGWVVMGDASNSFAPVVIRDTASKEPLFHLPPDVIPRLLGVDADSADANEALPITARSMYVGLVGVGGVVGALIESSGGLTPQHAAVLQATVGVYPVQHANLVRGALRKGKADAAVVPTPHALAADDARAVFGDAVVALRWAAALADALAKIQAVLAKQRSVDALAFAEQGAVAEALALCMACVHALLGEDEEEAGAAYANLPVLARTTLVERLAQWLEVDNVKNKIADDPFAVPGVQGHIRGGQDAAAAEKIARHVDGVVARLRETRAWVVHAVGIVARYTASAESKAAVTLHSLFQAVLKRLWAAAARGEGLQTTGGEGTSAAPAPAAGASGDAGGDKKAPAPKLPPPKKGSRAHQQQQQEQKKTQQQQQEGAPTTTTTAGAAPPAPRVWCRGFVDALLLHLKPAYLLETLGLSGVVVADGLLHLLREHHLVFDGMAPAALRLLASVPEGVALNDGAEEQTHSQPPSPIHAREAAITNNAKRAAGGGRKGGSGKKLSNAADATADAAGAIAASAPPRPVAALPRALEEWVWASCLLPAVATPAAAAPDNATADTPLALCLHPRVFDSARFVAYLERVDTTAIVVNREAAAAAAGGAAAIEKGAGAASGGKKEKKDKKKEQAVVAAVSQDAAPTGDVVDAAPHARTLLALCVRRFGGVEGGRGVDDLTMMVTLLEAVAALAKGGVLEVLLLQPYEGAMGHCLFLHAFLDGLQPLLAAPSTPVDNTRPPASSADCAWAALRIISDALKRMFFAIKHRLGYTGTPLTTADLPGEWCSGDGAGPFLEHHHRAGRGGATDSDARPSILAYPGVFLLLLVVRAEPTLMTPLLGGFLQQHGLAKGLPYVGEYYRGVVEDASASGAPVPVMCADVAQRALHVVLSGDAAGSGKPAGKAGGDDDLPPHTPFAVALVGLCAAHTPDVFRANLAGPLARRHQSLVLKLGRFGAVQLPALMTPQDVRSSVAYAVAAAMTVVKQQQQGEGEGANDVDAAPDVSTDPKVLRKIAALYEAPGTDRILGLQITAALAKFANTTKAVAKLVDVVLPGVLQVWRGQDFEATANVAAAAAAADPLDNNEGAQPFWVARAEEYLTAEPAGRLAPGLTEALLCAEVVLRLSQGDRRDVVSAVIADRAALTPWLQWLAHAEGSGPADVPAWFTASCGGAAALEGTAGRLLIKVDEVVAAEVAEAARREEEERERMRLQLEDEERQRVEHEKAAKALEAERLKREKEQARLEAEVKRKIEAEKKAAAKEEKKRRDAQAEFVRQAQKEEREKRRLEDEAQRAREAERARLDDCLNQDRACVAALVAIGVPSQKVVQAIKTCMTHDTPTLIEWLVQYSGDNAPQVDPKAEVARPAAVIISGTGAVRYNAAVVPASKRPFDPQLHRVPLLPIGQVYGYADYTPPAPVPAAPGTAPHHPVLPGEDASDEEDAHGGGLGADDDDSDDDYQDFWAIDVDLSKNLASFYEAGDGDDDDPEDEVDDLDPEDVAITRAEQGGPDNHSSDDGDSDDDVVYAHAKGDGGAVDSADGTAPARSIESYREYFVKRRAEWEAKHPKKAARAGVPPWHADYAPLLDLLDCATNQRCRFVDVKRYLRRDLGPHGFAFTPFADTWAFVTGLEARGLVKIIGSTAGVVEREKVSVALTTFGKNYHQKFWDEATSIAHRKPLDKARREERLEARKRQEAEARKRALDALLSMTLTPGGGPAAGDGGGDEHEEVDEIDPSELNLPEWFFEEEIADHERAMRKQDRGGKHSSYTAAELEALQNKAMEKRIKRLERAMAEANGTARPVVQQRRKERKKDPAPPAAPKVSPEEIAAQNRAAAAERAAERKQVEAEARKREADAAKASKRAAANRNKQPEVWLTPEKKLYMFVGGWVAFMIFLLLTSG